MNPTNPYAHGAGKRGVKARNQKMSVENQNRTHNQGANPAHGPKSLIAQIHSSDPETRRKWNESYFAIQDAIRIR